MPAILRATHRNPNRTLRVLASIAALPERFSRETGDYTTIRQIASKVFGRVWAMLFPDGRWMDAFHGLSNRLHSFDCASTIMEKSRLWAKTRRS